jgi:neuron navigator 2
MLRFLLSKIGHGSSLSLVSTASSLYSSQEEKQASEIRKLKRELAEANEKVNTLSGQLSTNVSILCFFFYNSCTKLKLYSCIIMI